MSSVTVVIPTYNRAHWIPETVESVLQQTHPADEILVVDDGSRDDTEAVCAALPAPVRYIRQENAGVSAARNRGAREARGEWVAFLDSDDLWEPEKLEVQLAAMEATPEARWSVTGCVLVDGENRPVPGKVGLEHAVPVFRELGASPRELLSRMLREVELEHAGERHTLFTGDAYGLLFYGNLVVPSSAMVRRDAFLASGGFDESFRLAEETEYFHRLAATAHGTIVLSPLLRWRVGHEERMTGNANMGGLVRSALLSNERAARLRERLTPAEDEARRRGRQQLLLKSGYLNLSLLERRAARDAVRDAWREGAPVSRRSLGIYGGSLLPAPVLRTLHRLKRIAS